MPQQERLELILNTTLPNHAFVLAVVPLGKDDNPAPMFISNGTNDALVAEILHSLSMEISEIGLDGMRRKYGGRRHHS